MIEHALRKRLQPIMNRRRRLYLAWRLSVYWFVLGLIGIALIGIDWLWGWKSLYRDSLFAGLCVAVVPATIWAYHKSRRIRLDYKAAARNIERQDPETKALILAALEQQPQGSDDQFGYLQERVIGDALRHAVSHNWLRSISVKKLMLADFIRIAMLLFLVLVLAQFLPSGPFTFTTYKTGILAEKDYNVTVSPEDTNVEPGTPVFVQARFDGRVPPEARLVFGPANTTSQEIVLGRILDDPAFGGIIPAVNQDLLYHIEYADRRTRDYRISVFEYPCLVKADAKIVYPSYTNLSEKDVKDVRQVSVVEGSMITMTFTLNKPVTTAQLIARQSSQRIESPDTQDLTVDQEHPNVYTASITAAESRRYELRLTDAQGLNNKMPPRFFINVLKNLPPELKPVFPNRDITASILEELTLEAEVSDDFGLTACGVAYTLAGTQSRNIAMSRPIESVQQQRINYLLALEELNAQPDQLLTYYFWANDIGPDGESRRVTSDIYFAELRHFEEIFRESQSAQDQQSRSEQERDRENQSGEQEPGQQGEQLARLQKQIIIATWNIKSASEQSSGVSGELGDHKADTDVVRQSQADARQQAQSALTQAEDPAATKALAAATGYMETSLKHLSGAAESDSTEELTPALAAEQSAYQELLKLREREHQVAQSRNPQSSQTSRSARFQEQLQQLELKQSQNRYETQRLAQSQQQSVQREDLQVLNRLRDLARRQNEMTERLREAEAALRQAQNEQQRDEILRELKRLREEQLEALRDVDELAERMENNSRRSASTQSRQRMADARERLSDSRSAVRQSAEQLEQGMVSRAINSTTRAQRELEQMRDEFQRGTSGQFTEQMQNMREQARQLDQQQTEIADEISRQAEARQKSLTDTGVNRELADRMDQQRKSAEELINQMRDVSEQADVSEPLLSRKLYDTVRRAKAENIDRSLDMAGQLLRRNFLPQAQEIERRAGQGIEQIRQGVEEAAQSVLGDEADALRLAQQQLNEAIRQIDPNNVRAGGSGRQQSFDPNSLTADRQNARTQGRNRPAGAETPEQGNNEQSAEQRQGRAAQAGSSPEQSQNNDTRTARAGTTEGNNPTGPGGNRRLVRQWDGNDPNGLGSRNAGSPFTGEDYTQWSDRLRDVQEMLTEQDLRNDLARVRDQARAIRAEFTRHGTEPQWDLVEQQITGPLVELHKRISEKLASLQSNEAMAPIDRDPVPSRFAEAVRRYYENLGGER